MLSRSNGKGLCALSLHTLFLYSMRHSLLATIAKTDHCLLHRNANDCVDSTRVFCAVRRHTVHREDERLLDFSKGKTAVNRIGGEKATPPISFFHFNHKSIFYIGSTRIPPRICIRAPSEKFFRASSIQPRLALVQV